MILSKLIKKMSSFRSQIYVWYSKQKLIRDIVNKKDKTIFFFITPTHPNLGDQAQLMCFLRIFKKILPEYQVICISVSNWNYKALHLIREKISANDLIYVQSGYKLSDRYNSDTLICKIVNLFNDFKITLLQQTINFNSEKRRITTSECLNNHGNITLFCRDETSYNMSKNYFSNCRSFLLPDIVTTLIGDHSFQFPVDKRNGVMLCLRNDKEKLYSVEQLEKLRLSLGDVYTEYSDTTNSTPIYLWNRNRDRIIRDYLHKMSRFQLIITDRYHGTIFSQIVNVPVIVISSTDHKLSTGVKWFPNNLFSHNMFFADSLESVLSIAQSILMEDQHINYNPPYFKETFFSDCKKIFTK